MARKGIYTVGGTVQASNGLYIPRKADDELLAICRAGGFAYILTPRQLGKSSLMVQVAQQLASEGSRSVIIDLTQIGVQVTAEEWYLGLLAMIEDQLGLETDVLGWWREHSQLGITQRLTLFFQEVLLKEVVQPVVLFVDEIDTTLSLNFTDDFFAAIRYFYNARAQAPEFKRLSFVLIGVATPSDLIRDPQRTPFNIGQRVDLTDFTYEEALPLAIGLGVPDEEAQRVLGWVLEWTNGHPYLTQRLCRAIAEQSHGQWSRDDVSQLVAATFFGDKSKQDHNLQYVADMLAERARLLRVVEPADVLLTYRAVLRNSPPVPDQEQSIIKSHLKLAGVVRREAGFLQVRNEIYREVFDEVWIKNALPPTWTKRQLARARKVQYSLAVLLLLVFLLAIGTTVFGINAVKQHREADKQREEAVNQSKIAKDASKRLEATLEELRVATAKAEVVAREATDLRIVAERANAGLRKANQTAEDRRLYAERQQEIALKAAADSYIQIKIAQGALAQARLAKDEAELQRKKAEDQEKIANAHASADQSFKEGMFLYLNQNRDQSGAIAKFEAALPYYDQINDKHSAAFTLSLIASAYVNSFDKTRAVEYYNRALHGYESIPDLAGVAETQIALGDNSAFSLDDKQEKQVDHYLKGLDAYRQVGDSFGQAATLLKIGDSYRKDVPKAIESYTQALEIYRKASDRVMTSELVSTLVRLASVTTGDKKKARDYYLQALALLKEAGDFSGQVNILSSLAWTYADPPQEQKELQLFYDKFLEEYRQTGNSRAEGSALGSIGDIYKKANKKDSAAAYYMKAYETYLRTGDDDNAINELLAIGKLFNDPGEEQKGPNFYKQLADGYRRDQDLSREAGVLVAMGEYYQTADEKLAALDYFNQALQRYQLAGDDEPFYLLSRISSISYDPDARRKLVSSLVTRLNSGDDLEKAKTAEILGTLYKAFGDAEHELASYEQSLGFYRKAGDRVGEASALLSLANTFQDRQKAVERYVETTKVFGDIHELFFQAKVYSTLGSYLDVNDPKAVENLKRALGLYDQMTESPGVIAAKEDTLISLASVTTDGVEKQKAVDQALALYRKNYDTYGEAQALLRLARRDSKKTVYYLEQLVSVFKRVNNRYYTAGALRNLGRFYAGTGQENQKAVDFLNQALDVYTALSVREDQISILRELSQLYEILGKKDEAHAATKRAALLGSYRPDYASSWWRGPNRPDTLPLPPGP
jgi:tetratricopeptide (TPR) repeat protein